MRTKTLAVRYIPLWSVPLMYLLLCLFWSLPVRADENPTPQPWAYQLVEVGTQIDQVQQYFDANDFERTQAQLIQLEGAVERLRNAYTPTVADTDERGMVTNDGLLLRLYGVIAYYYTQSINRFGCGCRPAQLSGLFAKYDTYLERVRTMTPPDEVASLRILDEMIAHGQAMRQQLKLASGA
jgi:hypothetical protein